MIGMSLTQTIPTTACTRLYILIKRQGGDMFVGGKLSQAKESHMSAASCKNAEARLFLLDSCDTRIALFLSSPNTPNAYPVGAPTH